MYRNVVSKKANIPSISGVYRQINQALLKTETKQSAAFWNVPPLHFLPNTGSPMAPAQSGIVGNGQIKMDGSLLNYVNSNLVSSQGI